MSDSEEPSGELGCILQSAQVLVRLEENVLAQVHGVFPVPHELQYVIEDTLLPPGYQQVVGIDIAFPRFPDQIPIFDFSKDQGLRATPLSPIIKTQPGGKKSKSVKEVEVRRRFAGSRRGSLCPCPALSEVCRSISIALGALWRSSASG